MSQDIDQLWWATSPATDAKQEREGDSRPAPCSADYVWRDLGDGQPVRVKKCSMCGIAPSAVDDCGMPNPDCPYFGRNNSKQNAKNCYIKRAISKMIKKILNNLFLIWARSLGYPTGETDLDEPKIPILTMRQVYISFTITLVFRLLEMITCFFIIINVIRHW